MKRQCESDRELNIKRNHSNVDNWNDIIKPYINMCIPKHIFLQYYPRDRRLSMMRMATWQICIDATHASILKLLLDNVNMSIDSKFEIFISMFTEMELNVIDY